VTRRGLILFGLMSLVWGIPYLFIRVAVSEVSPSVLVFGRTGLAALILLPFALLRGDLRPVLERWRWVVAFAAVEIGLPWVALASAEQQVSSSLAALLIAGVPLAGTILAAAMRSRDRAGLTGVLGLLLGLGGVAAIVDFNLRPANAPALLEMAVVVAGYAVGPVILTRRLGGLSSLAVMSLALALSALATAPFAVLQRPAALPSGSVLASIAVLAAVCTAAAFLLFSALIEEIGPVRATVITYINPAVAALLGVLVLHESFNAGMAIGFVLVLAGSVLATRSPRERLADPAPADRGVEAQQSRRRARVGDGSDRNE
jgi:drug/metabolite transporter (DMT)-like permease